MIFDKQLYTELLAKAAENERLRVACDLRNSADDKSQRMLNALQPGTVMPIHRHRGSNETIIVLSGCLEQLLYNDDGELTEKHIFKAGSNCCGMLIPAGQWHSINVLEPTVIFEAKDGAYAPLSPEDIMAK